MGLVPRGRVPCAKIQSITMKKLFFVILFIVVFVVACKAFDYVDKLMHPGPGVWIE